MALGITISFDIENGVYIGGIPRTIREHKGKSLLEFIDDYIVLDLETTGFDPVFDEIIEVGAIKYANGEKVSEFTTLVKPYNKIDEYITQLTGITNEMVKNAPNIMAVLPELNVFLGDSIIVAHNANFDINFIYDFNVNYIKKPFTNDFIDTMRISRRIFKDIRHRLVDLAEEFGIISYVQHRAMADCEITQKVYEYMKKHCYMNNIDISSLFRTSHGRTFNLKDFKPETEDFDVSHPIYVARHAVLQ